MKLHKSCTLSLLLMAIGRLAITQTPESPTPSHASTGSGDPHQTGTASPDLAKLLGISFPNDSQSTVILTREGRQYLIDVASRTVREIPGQTSSSGPLVDKDRQMAAALFSKNCATCHGPGGQGIKSIGSPNFTDPAFQKSVTNDTLQTAIQKGKGGVMPPWSGKLTNEQISSLVRYVRSLAPGSNNNPPGGASTSSSATGSAGQEQPKPKIYEPGDDVLVSLPTGRPTDRHGVYVNFAHRFPYSPAFTGRDEGAQLFGLDNVAIPSLGVRYGVTDNLSVSVFRAPSLVNRPIQLMAGYNILEEQKGNPLNLMVRLSIEGQDNFRKNYTENIEGILSRSITSRAQFYLVPTVSFNDRRLEQPAGFLSNQIPDVPGVNAFSLGAGLSIDIRPTVALVAEIIPTFANARELGIHRPAFSFGIQKKIWRHAFTLGLTNSPGTTVSQRAATRATFLNDPSADTFGGLVFGFDITRQIK
jgi:mono/diheme cytochrome c family protein